MSSPSPKKPLPKKLASASANTPKKPLPQKPASASANPDSNPSPAAPKPTRSTSDDEEKEEDEEGGGAGASGGEDSGSDSDGPAKLAKPPSSDSESDSDASPEKRASPRRPSSGPDPSVKPISTKPLDGTPSTKSKKPPTTPSTAGADKPKAPSSEMATEKRKRKAPEAALGAAEKEDANGSSDMKPFQRVWTEDDEIVVLKGMIEYQTKHGGADSSSPTEIGSFHEFIRKALHMTFTRMQVYDKIRRLKKKYATNMQRGRKGAYPSFAKAHEQAVFDLSKKIWVWKTGMSFAAEDGNGGGNEMEVEEAAEVEAGGKKGRQKSGARPVMASPPPREVRSGPATAGVSATAPDLMGSPGMNEEDWQGRVGAYPKLREVVAQLESVNAHTPLKGSFEKALELLEPSKAKSLEDRWSRHCMAEMELFFSRSELMNELVGALVKALDAATS